MMCNKNTRQDGSSLAALQIAPVAGSLSPLHGMTCPSLRQAVKSKRALFVYEIYLGECGRLASFVDAKKLARR